MHWREPRRRGIIWSEPNDPSRWEPARRDWHGYGSFNGASYLTILDTVILAVLCLMAAAGAFYALVLAVGLLVP